MFWLNFRFGPSWQGRNDRVREHVVNAVHIMVDQEAEHKARMRGYIVLIRPGPHDLPPSAKSHFLKVPQPLAEFQT